ncbi:MAG: FHA domain-containing protein [Pseudomonadota bacterium]
MALDARLLEFLACPQCKGGLTAIDEGKGLLCERCKLKYQVKNGIPVMISADAIDLRTGTATAGASVRLPRVTFRVSEGPETGMTFHLEQSACRAIGRATVDPNRTAVFNVDLALALDESTKSLVLQYISQQFQQKSGSGEMLQAGERLGAFRRMPDVVMTDPSLSRLHAMVFSDGENVAILDLVSKNGTFVNGQEIESHMLTKGDIVELGDTTIVFEK